MLFLGICVGTQLAPGIVNTGNGEGSQGLFSYDRKIILNTFRLIHTRTVPLNFYNNLQSRTVIPHEAEASVTPWPTMRNPVSCIFQKRNQTGFRINLHFSAKLRAEKSKSSGMTGCFITMHKYVKLL